MSRCPLSFLIAAALLWFPPLASAHAILLSSTPAVRAVVNGAHVQVKLRFNSRIDAKRSRLVLVNADGAQKTLEIGQQSSPDSLTAEVMALRKGGFILRWQVLASDGHITRGEIPFRVE
jgi:methionine-rich copper-binding protein CopC